MIINLVNIFSARQRISKFPEISQNIFLKNQQKSLKTHNVNFG